MTVRSDRIPLFPLPSVVLFPGVRVPLHIFEPRYRQMTRAALEGNRCIGMAVVMPQAQSGNEMAGDPPIFEIGCAGIIEQCEPMQDGRYDLVLAGTNRFRLVREIPTNDERLYRLGDVEPLIEASGPAEIASAAANRAELLDLLRRTLQRTSPERAAQLSSSQLSDVDDVSLVNGLCQSIDFEVIEKQSLLEANGVSDRSKRLMELLQFRAQAPSGSGTSGLVH